MPMDTPKLLSSLRRRRLRAKSSCMTAAALPNGLPNASPNNFIIEEAIKDSPRFRATLHQHVLYFNRLENRVNEMLRHLQAMMEYSRNYIQTFYKFTIAMNQLRDESFSSSALSQSSFNALTDAYSSTVSLFKNYHDESVLVVFNKLNQFVKQDLAKLATSRAHFDNMSSSMDEALQKNATISRQRPGEVAEYRNELTAVGTCFAHTSLDYVAQINLAHAKKDHIIIDALWSFVKETSSFFSRGHAVFDEWTASDDGGLADSITGLAANSKHIERKMQDIHSRVPKEMFQHPSGMSPDPDVMMEGYLLKRSSNAFKTWNRRWFQIRDNKLLYSHRSAELEQPTVMEENLKLCLVRPAPPSVDRVGCFELVTPTRTHLLQADSESLCNDWMRALQRTILALHESDDVAPKPSSSSSRSDTIHEAAGSKTSQSDTSSVYEQIRRVPGNDRCADCGRADPKWASINLGVVLCIDCAGAHRNMGVQVSKVRSLTMDSIDAELRDLLVCLGNKQVNSVYLAYLPETNIIPPEITELSTRQAREAWIKAKYQEKRFTVPQDERARQEAQARQDHLLVKAKSSTVSVNRSSSYVDVKEASPGCLSDRSPDVVLLNKRLSSCGSDPNIALPPLEDPSWPSIAEAARTGDILILLQALARGFDINGVHGGSTALHLAIQNGQTAAVEFLLLNGAKINVLDDRLNTPLHLAAAEGNTLQVCQLLKRGADKSLKNANGVTPLDIAVDGKHADIVTLFRVTTMRDEFNEEFDNPMDETVLNVINDITMRAATAKSAL